MAGTDRWTLTLQQHRLLYWLALGAPGWRPGDPPTPPEAEALPPVEGWLPERALVPAGVVRPELKQLLAAFGPDELLPGHRRAADAMAVVSGLYLIHDFLDDAHRLAQEADNRTAAYWHGIMHRREPDYDNARYWFRRVGDHPLFGPLGEAARRVLADAASRLPVEPIDRQGRWDAFAFVRVCEQLGDRARSDEPAGSDAILLARRLQGLEMKLLLAYSIDAAVGSGGGSL